MIVGRLPHSKHFFGATARQYIGMSCQLVDRLNVLVCLATLHLMNHFDHFLAPHLLLEEAVQKTYVFEPFLMLWHEKHVFYEPFQFR